MYLLIFLFFSVVITITSTLTVKHYVMKYIEHLSKFTLDITTDSMKYIANTAKDSIAETAKSFKSKLP